MISVVLRLYRHYMYSQAVKDDRTSQSGHESEGRWRISSYGRLFGAAAHVGPTAGGAAGDV